MRLLLECTQLYAEPFLNTGIQRVVRNVVTNLPRIDPGICAIPVILRDGKLHEVRQLIPRRRMFLYLNRAYAKLTRARSRMGLRLGPEPQGGRINAHGGRFWYRFGFWSLRGPLAALLLFLRLGGDGKRLAEIQAVAEDVLVLLDCSWHPDTFAQIEALKARGVAIVAVVYDVIPLTHPGFCDARLVVVFKHWFHWMSRTADGVMAISNATLEEVRDRFYTESAGASPVRPWMDSFQLGSSLDGVETNGAVREEVKTLFEGGVPVYLMVGTLEPRKNHGYLLDAFDRLWRAGVKVRLCLAGKVGWKCKDLIARIRCHAAFGQDLLMFSDLDDSELDYGYRHARCLVFPAVTEGFGLPIVEAMQRGLRVMASDIAVFREIGGKSIAYFDPVDPESLAAMIRDYETRELFPGEPRSNGSWPDWEEATRQFVSCIVHHLSERKAP